MNTLKMNVTDISHAKLWDTINAKSKSYSFLLEIEGSTHNQEIDPKIKVIKPASKQKSKLTFLSNIDKKLIHYA